MAQRFLGLLLLCALALLGLRLSSDQRPPAPRIVEPTPSVPPAPALPAGRQPAGMDPAGTERAGESRQDQARKPGKKRDKRDASEELFDPGLVPRISIALDRAAWRSLEQDPRRFVEATVVADGKTYSRVGVHLKGAAGSFRPLGDRPALTLKFNELVPGQRFHGLRKLHLNNSVQDASYLNELLAGELFRAAGVPAARTTHALVTLNGHRLGLYVLKEAFDRSFLRRHFQDDSGSLYDGGFCQDIDGYLENDTRRDSRDRSDLERLVAAAWEDDLEARWRRLGEVLDVDRFLSLLALEVLLWDWDGYPMKPNNYRVYHDPKSDRLVFIPHGMDQLLAQPEGPIIPPMGGLVARALLETPAGRTAYRERLAELHAKIFRPDLLERRIDEVSERLLPIVRESAPGRDRSFESRWMAARERIRARHRSVERQLLQRPPRPLALDGDGAASLAAARWYPEKDTDGVEAREVAGDGGEAGTLLLVDAHGQRCLGSWRCRVLLGRGAYTFRGRVKTEGVVPLADRKGAGAGLRLGGSQSPRRNQAIGSSPWQMLEHDFEVRGAHEEVELVCELRAMEGQAWFDRSSLGIVARWREE